MKARTGRVRNRPHRGTKDHKLRGVIYVPGYCVGKTVRIIPIEEWHRIKKAFKSTTTKLKSIERISKT